MPRMKGQRGPGFEVKRREIIDRARRRLALVDLGRPSMRELAAACETSVTTLRHYLGDREAVVRAVMEQQRADGEPHVLAWRSATAPFAESMKSAADYFLLGLKQGVAEILSVGLIEGLRHRDLGPSFLHLLLEPSVDALTARLTEHQARGEMRAGSAREAALMFVSPLLIAGLHQMELGGHEDWPMDLQAFSDRHVEAFVRSWSLDDGATPKT